MASRAPRSGGDFLERRNRAIRDLGDLPRLSDVLVVEDDDTDARRLRATLTLIFGRDAEVRHAATLNSAVDRVIERCPEIVFLDDRLPPSDTALQSIPFLRRAGYTGPLIIVSSVVTRVRRRELIAAGADDVIHKDDVDSVRLGETLRRLLGKAKPAPD
jgi:CheY-like chemotaxis protein